MFSLTRNSGMPAAVEPADMLSQVDAETVVQHVAFG